MAYTVEIEKVGVGGYITRLTDGRGHTRRFATYEEAADMAEGLAFLNDSYRLDSDARMRYEVIEVSEPEYIAERDPRHGMKP